ncbi:MAG: hypothetical protein QM687_11810 [Ferruginibacter sp.]
MKKYLLSLVFAVTLFYSNAQDVDYKKGIITVDGKELAKLEVKKENFGLTKSFQVFSMSGKKLIIAAVATEFEQDKTDNTYLFYRLTFLTSNQVGIFKVASLGQEKSFAKLIGNSGIIKGDSTDDNSVKEFIALKGASPRIATDYSTVNRNKAWPIELKEDKTITQDGKVIGSFKSTGSYNGMDQYEFLLPSTVVIAKVSFTGGNNAQNFEVFTAKDSQKRVISIASNDKVIAAAVNVDKNWITLKKVIKWLVDNQYL